MKTHLLARRLLTCLIVRLSLVAGLPYSGDILDSNNPSIVATNTSQGYGHHHLIDDQHKNIKRQYAYVTQTAPGTITYTSTVYNTVTSHATYTQYAVQTVTVNAARRALAGVKRADAASSQPVKTVTTTTTIHSLAPGDDEAGTNRKAKTSVAASCTSASSSSSSSSPEHSTTEPDIMVLSHRDVPAPITVTQITTPSTTILVTSTITAPGVWIASTIFTATVTVQAAAPPPPPLSTVTVVLATVTVS